MTQHVSDLVAWSVECSAYLADKLPELDEVAVHFVYGNAEQRSTSGCRCVFSFLAFPTAFVRDIVVPEMMRILDKHTGGTGRTNHGANLSLKGERRYSFVCPLLGRETFDYARSYFRPGKQTTNKWERRSKMRRVPAGQAPLFAGRLALNPEALGQYSMQFPLRNYKKTKI